MWLSGKCGLVALSGDGLYVSRYSPVPLNHCWFAFSTFIVCMDTEIMIIIIYEFTITYSVYIERHMELYMHVIV